MSTEWAAAFSQASLWWAIGGGLLCSFFIEQAIGTPLKPVWQRAWQSTVLHLGTWLGLFVFELLQWGRPFFCAAIVSGFLLLIVLVSRAKQAVLREVFIFQDFEYFLDVIRHPRLYLPFLGWWRLLAAVCAFVVFFAAGLCFEAHLVSSFGWSCFAALCLGLAVLSGGCLMLVWRWRPTLCYVPESDTAELGLFAALWAYGRAEADTPQPLMATNSAQLEVARPRPPDLLVVQSESFFDPRSWCQALKPDLLSAFTALQNTALQAGRLRVPAWGANTVRTEFAFLTGLAAQTLGVHRFNPYRCLPARGVKALPALLKAQGYRTVCVHPYPAGFYQRDKVFPLLGFDEFIDLQAFSAAERVGHYVSDVALGEFVSDLLAAHVASDQRPIFLFVITMENHGPLHLETVPPEAASLYCHAPVGTEYHDLLAYARHLHQADQMFARLQSAVQASPRLTRFCVYGDHVPIMPKVYAIEGLPSGETDYFIWQNTPVSQPIKANCAVEDLAKRLLGA